MELTKNFEHGAAENKWYRHWLDNKYFNSKPDEREPYTIVMPPPNVTGILHMGHALNNTIQDILIRRARMLGKNACWVPGTDHASIATEAKVVQKLREKGISKSSLSRDEFLAHAWEWKEQYGGIILQQLRKLGCSADWDRTTFTMDPDYYSSVISVFIDLFNKGYIYRGKRMINWDPKAKTALSDEEVIRKETQSKLYYLKYKLDAGSNPQPSAPGYLTIATVRPETILGDTAIAVNPKDERYKNLHGKFAFVPLINRRIPIIVDDYVEMDFGTGALKITPAHDKNDYQIGEKHRLEVIDILNDDGTLSEAAQLYIGEDRFEARKKIVKELEEKGFLDKTENYTNQLGFSERTDVVVEDRLSMQWWVDMKKLYEPALNAVIREEINFFPARFKNLYRNWMENIRDWCISRQLWWGQRIPAWYDEEGHVFVAETEEKVRLATNYKGKLTQDEDVLDTWFSSWLWPIEVFKGYSHPGNADIQYYYPTNTLVTAPEIIFFWVARMIVAGFEYKHEKPFTDVYFTGIVRDELGRKMSKQLGNSPDLLGLIDKYGADAVRFGTMITSPAGNDLLFDVKEESTLKQGSFFINKIWNALKLVNMWKDRQSPAMAEPITHFAVEWFENRLNQVKGEIETAYKAFRLSEILKTIYSLVWDDFCSWYLEWVKPEFEKQIDSIVYERTISFFEELMQLLHPFMPFITEDIYHQLKQRVEGDDLTIKQVSSINSVALGILEEANILKQTITGLRDVRNDIKFSPKQVLKIRILSPDPAKYERIKDILSRQGNAEISIEAVGTSGTAGAAGIVIGGDVLEIINEDINTQDQEEELKKELSYARGFLASVEKKLGNEKFMSNAKPEIIDLEKKKKQDAEKNISSLEERLSLIESKRT